MPSVIVKNLQQKGYPIEYKEDWTVLDLKKELKNPPHKVDGEADAIKLIYSGKILADDKRLSEFTFKDKDFLVLMVSKKKPAPAASTSAASTSTPAAAVPATPANPAAPAAAAPNAPAPAPAPAAAPAATTPSEGQQQADDGTSMAIGPALQTSVNEIVNMGFPRDQVMRAMRASFNNPHRAVDYLMNGIPEGLGDQGPPGGAQGQTPAPQPRSGAAVPETPATPSPAGAGGAAPLAAGTPAATPAPAAGGGGGNLFEQAAAAAHAAPPQGAAGGAGAAAGGRQNIMEQIRHLAQTNPAALNHLLGPLIQANPELAGQDPQALLQQLAAGAGDDDDDEMMAGLDDPNVVRVELNPQEQQEIESITAMGFSRQVALEAFLAADRNPDDAVNLLLNSDFGDEPENGGQGGQ